MVWVSLNKCEGLKYVLNVRRGKYSFLMVGVVVVVLMIGCLIEYINLVIDSF